MLETIGISRLLTENEISVCLNSIFPNLEFVRISYDSIEGKKKKSNEVWFFMYPTHSEYPIRIEILFQQENNTEEREQYIAKAFSEIFNCRQFLDARINIL